MKFCFDFVCHKYTQNVKSSTYYKQDCGSNFLAIQKKVHDLPGQVERKANVRNRYSQVQCLTLNTLWENDKNTRIHTEQEREEVSPFPAGEHQAARNRQDILQI